MLFARSHLVIKVLNLLLLIISKWFTVFIQLPVEHFQTLNNHTLLLLKNTPVLILNIINI